MENRHCTTYGVLYYLVKLDDGYTLKRQIDQLKTTRVQQRKVRFAPDIADDNIDSSYSSIQVTHQ